jgi:hypothetical protein
VIAQQFDHGYGKKSMSFRQLIAGNNKSLSSNFLTSVNNSGGKSLGTSQSSLRSRPILFPAHHQASSSNCTFCFATSGTRSLGAASRITLNQSEPKFVPERNEHREIAMVLAHFPLAFEPRDDKAETDNTAHHDLTSEGE